MVTLGETRGSYWLGLERWQLCLQDTSSCSAKCYRWAAVGHCVSLCVCSVVGWLIVYQLGRHTISVAVIVRPSVDAGEMKNACLGVRNTSSIGAWPNSLDQRPPWYFIVSPLLQTNRKNVSWNYNFGIPIQHQKGFNLIVLLFVVGLRVAPGKFLCCTFSYHYDGWSLSGLRGLGEYSTEYIS